MVIISTLKKKFFSIFLNKYLPDRMKRLICLASLGAKIDTSERPDKDIALKLNQTMVLSQSHQALFFPMHLSEVLWSKPINIDCKAGENSIKVTNLDEIFDKQLTTVQIRILSDQIFKVVPDWLKYGSKREIKNDINLLLTTR